MILDRSVSYANRPHQPVSADPRSRRNFLRAGAAAGGGLLLSLGLPFANTQAYAAVDDFAPNAFIRVGTDGQIHLYLNPNADRRRA